MECCCKEGTRKLGICDGEDFDFHSSRGRKISWCKTKAGEVPIKTSSDLCSKITTPWSID